MEAKRPQAPLSRQEHRTNWRMWTIAIVALLLLILIIQNSQKVELHFFFADTQMPLFFALLIAAVLGALVGWLLPRFRRSRKVSKDEG
jgi:uncharacterized integral membrane protein